MSITVIRGTNNKPVSSERLATVLSKTTGFSGHLFIGYPIIGTSEGPYPIDALLVSPEKGVVIFDLVEGHDLGEYDVRQDDSANKLEARLKPHRNLVKQRQLVVPIATLSFAPGVNEPSRYEKQGYPLSNVETLNNALSNIDWEGQNKRVYEATLSAIESISTIRKSRVKRNISDDDSRGAKLKQLEDSIATLDNLQSKAVIETVKGVQRIRGLAGSGKTIVLALKAAYLHAQHPEWRIAVTFNTRSLKGQFRRLINNFVVEQAGEEPDWDALRILNAWGAPGGGAREGIYHEFCKHHDVEYLDFRSARGRFGQSKEFAGACAHALRQARSKKAVYNAILVDEAQDFPPAFLRLCFEMLDENSRLVYAYDELQNLSGESLPSPEDIFGKHKDGSPRVQFEGADQDEPRRDIILRKCYRNSRPVLVTAHALGFGVYRKPPKQGETGLVQMFDHPQLWEDIGYEIKDGALESGKPITLYRPEESSPRFLENHSVVDDLLVFKQFDNEDDQDDWVVQEIEKNLNADELRHDDIVVINPDPITTRNKVGTIRSRLLEMGINSHLAGVDTDPDVFFSTDESSITFTGIFRAKGNESGMVYIINAHDCHTSALNLARVRNRLFTAITRSKAWVRVLGVGEAMNALCSEYDRLKRHGFELAFTYPTEVQRDHLKLVHRDMTAKERNRLKSRERSLLKLISDLESGNVLPEDLDEELLNKLEKVLRDRKG